MNAIRDMLDFSGGYVGTTASPRKKSRQEEPAGAADSVNAEKVILEHDQYALGIGAIAAKLGEVGDGEYREG